MFDSGPASTDDVEVDIISLNPSNRSTDNIVTLVNGFNVDATAIEHLFDGTIIQGAGPTEERWDGIVNFGPANAHIQIIQDGAILADDYWNYGYEEGTHLTGGSATVMTDTGKTWTNDEWIGYTIRNIDDGSQGLITDNTADTITVAYLYGGTADTWTTSDRYHIAKPINGDAGQGISHRFMIKTREDGVDIDRRRLIGTTRRWGNTFAEFKINGTSQGNNVLALSDSNDLNNETAWATIDAITDVTNQEGLRDIDINGDGSTEEYYSEWTRGAQTINTFYEHLKADSMDSTAVTLNGQNGELHRGVTHSASYDTETGGVTVVTNDKFVYGTYINHGTVTGGPFEVGEAVHEDTATPVWKGRVLSVDGTDTSLIVDVEFGTVGNTEAFTGQTSGAQATTSSAPTGEEIQNAGAGEFAIFADDDVSALYGQITKGVAMQDNTRLYDPADHTDYFTCDAAAVERAVSTPFVGVSTGSALIGAYGLGLESGDTAAADTYFDLSGAAITPPNNVTFTVTGLEDTDRVLCTNNNAGDIDFAQMQLNASYSATNVTTISVNAIPIDCPSSGTIRIERNDGLYSRHPFSARDLPSDDFTITSFDFSTNGADSGNNVFISYLDKANSGGADESFSYVFNATRTHFVRARNASGTPIKTAETTGDMTSTGGTASINRIEDV
jgi:hypothetical protein